MGLTLAVCGAVLARVALAGVSPSSAHPWGVLARTATAEVGSSRMTFRLKWLADLGAESLAASPQTAGDAEGPVVSVPGVAYAFAVGADGALMKKMRLAADPAAPYGMAPTALGVALANQQGSASLWTFSPGGGLSLRWRRDLGERATSVAWSGGESVLFATWRHRLVALSASEGRVQWTTDIGGRAEAPAVVDGGDVFVATKAKTLLRLDALTGSVRWKVELPGLALHPPVLLGEKPRLVVCGTWDGRLLAHDPATGRVRWTVSLPGKLSGAPLGGPELVFSVTADGSVHAHDSSGAPRWVQAAASEGGASLLRPAVADTSPRLIVVSKSLVALDAATGRRLGDYPRGAVEGLKRRFADAMLEGVKTYSEGEKRALLEREAFDIAGPLFGPARLVGRHLSFGTEEGWAYVFDSSTLRPLGRYHAGQACTGVPLMMAGAGRILAMAGDQLFGIDPTSGRVLWQRTVGAEAGGIGGGATPGIVAGGQFIALDPADGLPRFSLRGRFRSVAPPTTNAQNVTPWLADDGDGNLRALWPGGRLGGAPLPAGGELLPIESASPGSWVAATREGKVFAVSWEQAIPGTAESTGASQDRLVKLWEKDLRERLAEVRAGAGRIAVRTESEALLGLDEQGQELWRLRLSSGERFELVPQASALLILGVADLRVHDWTTGEPRFQWKVATPAVGADIRGNSLLWLDGSGGAFQVEIGEGRPLEAQDLGVPLARASATERGFLVTTTAGELGLVELTTDSADPGREQARVVGRFVLSAKRGGEP